MRALGKRSLAGIVLIGSLLIGCGAGPGGGETSPSPAPAPVSATPSAASASPSATSSPTSQTTAPEHSGLKTATLQSSKGLPWELVADQVEWNDPTRRAKALKVQFTLWDKAKEKKTLVAAAGANVDVESERIEFQGRVTARGAEGEALTVNRLVWDGKQRKFFGDKGVRVERDGSVVEGERLVASPDLRHFEILGGVRGVMDVPEEPQF